MLLKVEGLKTRFETGQGVVHAVDGVDLELEAGDSLGVVGESGCGKSVTMLSIMRLLSGSGRVVSGRVLLDGENLLDYDAERMRQVRGARISMVFQDPMTSLNPLMTIGEQIAEAVMAHKRVSREEAMRQAVRAMERVRIPEAARRAVEYPHQFSGGMRQRAMIAIAIACKPRLLIADEPTTALDVTVQAQIINLLRELRRSEGMSIILVTHDLRVAAQLCRRLSVFYAGRIIEEGLAGDVLRSPGHPYTRGLIGALPGAAQQSGRLQTIGGQPPNMVDVMPGCRFEPRCPLARDICRESYPAQTVSGHGHRVFCHFYRPEEEKSGA